MFVRLIPLAVLVCCTPALATPLTPSDQAVFAKSASETCVGDQAAAAANRNLTVGQLQNFCACYGKAFSEYITLEELPKIQESLTPEAQKMAGVFMQKCAVSALKK